MPGYNHVYFGEVLYEFSATLVEESVGGTNAADSEEKAKWDGFKRKKGRIP